MTTRPSPVFTNTYPHALDLNDLARRFEQSRCDMEEFGSAVTPEDQLAVCAEEHHQVIARQTVTWAMEPWERPGNDAMRITQEPR